MIAASILYLYVKGIDPGTAAEQLLNGMYSSYLLLAIPLFILAAEFMNSGSIMDRLLRFCNALVGRWRGGLAHVNVVQSIIFAGMSGSALADAASSGKVMQSLMTRDGKYTPAFAAALTAVSSVIGPIIPPSIPMVLYALISDTSIAYLFLGGWVPRLPVRGGQIARTAAAVLTAHELSPLTFLLFATLLLLLLGCFLEGTTILLVIVPVLLPTATALGIDPVHFGVVVVVNIMIGLVTPPYGLLLFLMVKIGEVSLTELVREVMPFLWVMIGALAVMTFIPDVVLFLPKLFGYKG